MKYENKDFVEWIKRHPVVVGLSIWIIILLAVIYFRSGVADDLQTQLDQAEKRLTAVSNNVKFAVQLESHLDELKEANTTLQNFALRHSDVANNQQYFYQLEAESNVKLIDLRQSAQPSAAKPGALSTYTPVSFTLTVQGSYESLIAFLKRLETSSTLAKFNYVAFGQPSENIQSVDVNLDLLGIR